MLQWAHMGVRVPAGMCSAIWTTESSSLGWAWGTGRDGMGPLGALAVPLPFIPKDGVIKPVCGPRTAEVTKDIKVTNLAPVSVSANVCFGVFMLFLPRCVSYLTSALFVYTPSRCHSSAHSWLVTLVTTTDSPHHLHIM